MPSRIETIAWCLAPIALTVAGCGWFTVMAVMLAALIARWIASEVFGAFRTVFGRQ